MGHNNTSTKSSKNNNLDFFHTEKLKIGLVILKVNTNVLNSQKTDLFINTISVLISKGHKDILIDLTETENLDTYTVTELLGKTNEIESLGGTIRFLATKDRPILKLSPRKLISQMQVYLNFSEALKDFRFRKN